MSAMTQESHEMGLQLVPGVIAADCHSHPTIIAGPGADITRPGGGGQRAPAARGS
jgi:hypothetical protein